MSDDEIYKMLWYGWLTMMGINVVGLTVYCLKQAFGKEPMA